MSIQRFDLEERLIGFACRVSDLAELLPKTRSGNYLCGQLVRAGYSPAFNYGEAQAAESRQDFIHKMAIVLKELKECRVAIKIIHTRQLVPMSDHLQTIFQEGEELIAIVGKSIRTAKENIRKGV